MFLCLINPADFRIPRTGEIIVGAGVGVAAVAAPLYAAELAPALTFRDIKDVRAEKVAA